MVGFTENAVAALSSVANSAINWITGSEPEVDPNADADPLASIDYIMIE